MFDRERKRKGGGTMFFKPILHFFVRSSYQRIKSNGIDRDMTTRINVEERDIVIISRR